MTRPADRVSPGPWKARTYLASALGFVIGLGVVLLLIVVVNWGYTA